MRRFRPKAIAIVVALAAASVSGFFVSRLVGGEPAAASPDASGSAKSATAGAREPLAVCERYVSAESQIRWLCDAGGAPVDVVNAKSNLLAVVHRPARVLTIDASRLGTAATAAPPKPSEPQAICVLEGPHKGIAGFAFSHRVNEKRCQ